MNLEHITRQSIQLVKEVGSYIKSESLKFKSTDIEEKGLHDLVSYVDKTAEQKLVEGLSEILPEAGFIAEENPSLKRTENFNWIVDPLDGTTNFLHGVPVFSISVALIRNDELIAGIVFEINRNECFYAWEGSPAFLNEKPISVTQTNQLNKSLVATGFPYSDYSLVEPYLKLFHDLMKSTRGIRRLGSAAVDLAYVACGRFDVFYEYGLNPWDVAAGLFIVKQAGGKVSDFKGGDDYLFGRQIIASNAHIYQIFHHKLNQYFSESN